VNIVIVKYNAGNIHSVRLALNRIGVEPQVTDDSDLIRKADKVIFPGVGEASSAMNYLRARGIDQVLAELEQPVLGICLGLQLMCAASEENHTRCLGIFNQQVKKFPPEDKVPHMGWNLLEDLSGPLFRSMPASPYVYFVHSFYAETGPDTCARTTYILPFSAAIVRDNFMAVQFHPEKSGTVGEKILTNFVRL
jgi:glutamine amidotransferase